MEQMEPITAEEYDSLPLPDIDEAEPRWDPEKAARPKVRVIEVPYGRDPMKKDTTFEFGGFVYVCYAKKTRGRSFIQCLGLAEKYAERCVFDEQTPLENFKEAAGDALREALDKDIMATIVNEAEGDGMKESIDDEISTAARGGAWDNG